MAGSPAPARANTRQRLHQPFHSNLLLTSFVALCLWSLSFSFVIVIVRPCHSDQMLKALRISTTFTK